MPAGVLSRDQDRQLRHSYVSLRHDAGFSLERIGDEVGHSSAYMTDAYRHLSRATTPRQPTASRTTLTRAASSRPTLWCWRGYRNRSVPRSASLRP